MSDQHTNGLGTHYVADPIQISDDLYVGIVVERGNDSDNSGVDLLDENYNTVVELNLEECKNLVKELAEFITA